MIIMVIVKVGKKRGLIPAGFWENSEKGKQGVISLPGLIDRNIVCQHWVTTVYIADPLRAIIMKRITNVPQAKYIPNLVCN